MKKIKKIILDILFPIFCFFCHKPDEWICQTCLDKIKIIDNQVCPYCEKQISPFGKICQHCKTKFLTNNKYSFLDSLIVSSNYKENNLSRLIHRYKYNFVYELDVFLAKIMLKSLIKHNLPLPDIIIPIPLHSRRLRWRGFNQSELLAKQISENITPNFSILTISNLLIRKKFTSPQMKIKNYTERKLNIKNAFSINPKADLDLIKNKTILLVDDVATTGSTLFECAKILKENGARCVTGVVLARQEIK